MDSRLNLAIIESRNADLRRRAAAAAAPPRRWPDDGLPPRVANERRSRSLHPTAVLASVLTGS